MDIEQILNRYEFVTLKTNTNHKIEKYEFNSKNYCFLDIETAKTNESLTVAQAISFSMCDYKNTFALCSNFVTNQQQLYIEMLELVYYFTSEKTKKQRCYYHNSTFDCTFLLIQLNKMGYTQVDIIDAKKLTYTDKYYTLIVSNNQIIQLEYSYKGKIFQIWDTFKIWATSLATVSKECVTLNNKAKEKNQHQPFPNILDKVENTNFDYNKIRTIGDRYTKTDIEYCVNDVVSSSAIIKLFSFLDLKMTISATAYNTCMKSFIDSLYIHKSILYLLKYMILDNILDSINIASLLHSERNNAGYNIYSKNYYEEYNKDTLISFISFDILKYKHKTTIKTLYKHNFELIKDKILQHVINVDFSNLHSELLKNTLFYEYKYKDFISLYQLLKYFFTFDRGGKVKTSSEHFKDVSIELEKFKDKYFPNLSEKLDEILRKGYNGGICQVNSLYQYQLQTNVYHIDINSSYPHKAKDCQMPIGLPKIYNEYIEKTHNTICMYVFVCDYSIKNGYLPIVMSKNRYGMSKMSTQDTVINMVKNNNMLYMYDAEYKLFLKHYHVENLKVLQTYVFQAKENLLFAYNDKYYKLKQTKKGTALYTPAKILLNSVTGKFGQNKYKMEKYKTVADFSKGFLQFKQVENSEYNSEKIKGYYLPVVSYITALARVQLITACDEIMENGGKVFYMDTDSIFFSADNVNINTNKYLTINSIVTNILIDKNILGAWDLEHANIQRAMFINPKRYFLDIDGTELVKDVKIAGVSKKYTEAVTLENFKLGNSFKTIHRKKTENGVDLIVDTKELRYSEILYKTDKCTISSTEIYKKGDVIYNIYNEKCVVESILYCPPKFEKEVKKFENI